MNEIWRKYFWNVLNTRHVLIIFSKLINKIISENEILSQYETLSNMNYFNNILFPFFFNQNLFIH